jgi:tRNA U34 5-methylaminomethyl-2-thiouridine-forming methyltransferase MnmC
VDSDPGYKLVKVASGAHSVHSLAYRETFHPVIGPAAEAEALYIRQTRLIERLQTHTGQFVIWDVGLGSAANPLTVLRALGQASHEAEADEEKAKEMRLKPAAEHPKGWTPNAIRFVSFDQTVEPLKFALGHANELEFLRGYEEPMEQLIRHSTVSFNAGSHNIEWQLHLADFPAFLSSSAAETLPKPHLIMFDAFSPATNPAMWTLPLFTRLHRLLDSARPCVLPTYSRSTMLRVTLLLAGFFVGIGHATGEKEETTVAANQLELVEEPLGRRWLQRVRRSTSAEPLHEPVYRQAKLSAESWDRLERHSQWAQVPV